jgi:hypothetical protein
MKPETIARLRELLSRATPGEWETEVSQGRPGLNSGWEVYRHADKGWESIMHSLCNGEEPCKCFDDATLVVAAVNALGGLLDELEEFRAAREIDQGVFDKIADEARREAIEECARVAENQELFRDTQNGMRQRWIRGEIARKCRALLASRTDVSAKNNEGQISNSDKAPK